MYIKPADKNKYFSVFKGIIRISFEALFETARICIRWTRSRLCRNMEKIDSTVWKEYLWVFMILCLIVPTLYDVDYRKTSNSSRTLI